MKFGKGKMNVWFNGVTPTKENKVIKQRDTASQHFSPGSGMHETVGEEEHETAGEEEEGIKIKTKVM